MRYEMRRSYLLGPFNSNGNESSAAVPDKRDGLILSLLFLLFATSDPFILFLMEQTSLLFLRKVALTLPFAYKETLSLPFV